jgi:hypothetical protein
MKTSQKDFDDLYYAPERKMRQLSFLKSEEAPLDHVVAQARKK